MAEIKVIMTSGTMACMGLGSCMAVALYDEPLKIAGLAHIVLPHSQLIKPVRKESKFADIAIELMINKMLKLGAHLNRLKAKIFGGSTMFASHITKSGFNVGNANIEAVLKELKTRTIPIIAQDIGGHYGRTIYFYVETGIIKMNTLMNKTELIF